ncbi:MAG TPA: fibronectin type III domain-containing protein [Candidatus Dormibacteraeota bacterium]
MVGLVACVVLASIVLKPLAVGAGATWATQATVNPAGSAVATLNGVACLSPSWCMADGSSRVSGGGDVPLTELWTTSWTTEAIANPSGAINTELTGISCPTSTMCVAVGDYSTPSGWVDLAEQWNGSSWAMQSIPAPAPDAYLTGVNCPDSSFCMAAGYYDFPSGRTVGAPIAGAAAWNGSTWSWLPVPLPAGTGGSFLDGVSCTTPAACTAVGWDNGNPAAALAERWDGSAWSVQTTPNVASTDNGAALRAVSCPTASSCLAVGYGPGMNFAGVLAEKWDGTTWTSMAAPNPSGTTSAQLAGVSCLGPNDCTAVGYFNSAGSPSPASVIERWNGSAWTLEQTPTDSSPNTLAAVSSVAGWRTAVGQSNQLSLAEASSSATVPGAPLAVQATAGNASATVGWSAPADGGSAISGYTVTTYIAGVAQSSTQVSGGTWSTTISGLANGSTYTFGVTATNSIGTGPESAASKAVTPSSFYPAAGYVVDGWGGVHPFGPAPAAPGSAYWAGQDIARGIATAPNRHSGYVLDGWGGIHPFGGAASVAVSAYWSGWDIARALVLDPCDSSGASGYVLDGWGGIHPFGGAPGVSASGYWPGWDIGDAIAMTCAPGYEEGLVLDRWGGLHPFALASRPMPPTPAGAYWPGWNIARGLAIASTTSGNVMQGVTLDGWGGVHGFGGVPDPGTTGYWPGWDIARAILMVPDTDAGYVLDGWGGIHPFGGAPATQGTGYWAGWDIARGIS